MGAMADIYESQSKAIEAYVRELPIADNASVQRYRNMSRAVSKRSLDVIVYSDQRWFSFAVSCPTLTLRRGLLCQLAMMHSPSRINDGCWRGDSSQASAHGC
jgi:hypothetical protein